MNNFIKGLIVGTFVGYFFKEGVKQISNTLNRKISYSFGKPTFNINFQALNVGIPFTIHNRNPFKLNVESFTGVITVNGQRLINVSTGAIEVPKDGTVQTTIQANALLTELPTNIQAIVNSSFNTPRLKGVLRTNKFSIKIDEPLI